MVKVLRKLRIVEGLALPGLVKMGFPSCMIGNGKTESTRCIRHCRSIERDLRIRRHTEETHILDGPTLRISAVRVGFDRNLLRDSPGIFGEKDGQSAR